MKYSQRYNSLLTNDYIEHYITDPNIATEYGKLVNAVSTARDYFMDNGSLCKSTGIVNDFTLMKNRSVINCAEIWSAREMILQGYNFDDITLFTRHADTGTLFKPCKNCRQTFISIL